MISWWYLNVYYVAFWFLTLTGDHQLESTTMNEILEILAWGGLFGRTLCTNHAQYAAHMKLLLFSSTISLRFISSYFKLDCATQAVASLSTHQDQKKKPYSRTGNTNLNLNATPCDHWQKFYLIIIQVPVAGGERVALEWSGKPLFNGSRWGIHHSPFFFYKCLLITIYHCYWVSIKWKMRKYISFNLRCDEIS